MGKKRVKKKTQLGRAQLCFTLPAPQSNMSKTGRSEAAALASLLAVSLEAGGGDGLLHLPELATVSEGGEALIFPHSNRRRVGCPPSPRPSLSLTTPHTHTNPHTGARH